MTMDLRPVPKLSDIQEIMTPYDGMLPPKWCTPLLKAAVLSTLERIGQDTAEPLDALAGLAVSCFLLGSILTDLGYDTAPRPVEEYE